MSPRPYQSTGVLHLADHRRTVLADEPGLGKTIQLILAAKLIEALTILVICPAVAVVNWLREFRIWWPEARPVVVSYDRISQASGSAAGDRLYYQRDWDLLILDEVHYLKNRDAGRTKKIYRPNAPEKGLTARAKFCWVASGTMAPNAITEYWTHLRVLRPDLIPMPGAGRPMSWTEFLMRYTTWSAGPYSIRIHGLRNREELTAILGRLGIRRTVEDVLPDLPALCWGTVAVDDVDAAADLAAMEATPEVEAIRERYEEHGDFHATNRVHLATLRRLIGDAKAPAVVDLVDTELSAGHYKKIVVWGWHTSVLRRIYAGLDLHRPVLVYGGTSPVERQKAIDRFQNDPACRVFLGQIIAAGTAITLTAASQVLFAESSWVPDEDLQAAKRCHRIGQKCPVFARYAVLAGSTDELVAEAQARKLSQKVEIGAN